MALLTIAAISLSALLRTSMNGGAPLTTPDMAAPHPQNGVWALVPSDCETPVGLDLSAWPKCATPLGFMDDEIAALERPGPGKKATPDQFYSIGRTKFSMAPAAAADAPEIAEIAVPMVFSRSYYYLAIKPDAVGDDGRFAAARGWPVPCPPKEQGGCTPRTLTDVQAQAAIEPDETGRIYRLIRVQPAAPPEAPATAPAAPATPTPVVESTLPPATPQPDHPPHLEPM